MCNCFGLRGLRYSVRLMASNNEVIIDNFTSKYNTQSLTSALTGSQYGYYTISLYISSNTGDRDIGYNKAFLDLSPASHKSAVLVECHWTPL